MARDVREVGLLDALEGVEVAVRHRLDDELLVLREEEETSTLSLRLTGLEDHGSVDLRVQRLSDRLVVITVLLAEESEHVGRVLRDLDVLIDDQLILELFDRLLFLRKRATASRTAIDAGGLLVVLDEVKIPVLAIIDLDRVENEFVLVRVVVVLVHLVAVLALWRAHSILRHSGQDDVYKLDIERTHQERQQGAVHAVGADPFVRELAEELPYPLLYHSLEDGLPHAYYAHQDTCANAGQVVRVKPVVQLLGVLVEKILVRFVRALDGSRKEDEEREAEVR